MRKAIALIAIGLAISGCETTVDVGGGGPSPDRFNQTFGFQLADGARGTMAQTLTPGTRGNGSVRICFINNGRALATLLHGTPGINPMSAAPGSRSCANFGSSLRVNFTLMESGGGFPTPAVPDRNFVYSLSAFDGGLLNLTWTTN